MRIMYLHQGYFPSLAGAEMMARMIAAQIQHRGHTVCLCMGTHHHHAHYLQHEGIPIVALPSFQPQAVQALLPWQPDIIHVIDAVDPSFPRAGLDIAQAWQIPFVMTPASAIDTWQDAMDTIHVCRNADLLYALTNQEAQLYVQAGVPKDRLLITGQGPYLAGQADPASFRRYYGITGSLVLFLGRKVRFKGYHLLLAACKSLWTQRPDTTVLFMGPRWDSDCQAVFQSFADSRIIEVDAVTDDQKLSALHACNVLCLPTMIDVFPLVFVEAWACGKPVISTPFPGVQDVIRNGVDGFIAAPDAPSLAETIVRLLNNPTLQQTLGAAGYERVQRELNWETIADHIEASYHQLFSVRR